MPWKTVALPIEHGGWGFLGEPVALGLVIAPSFAGLALATGALFAFLARHPARLAAMDRRRKARYPRTALAERFAAAFAAAALAMLALAWVLARHPFWPALVAAAPFAIIALWYDLSGRSREATAETIGAVALCSSAAAIALAGGARPGVATGAALLLALRAAASVLYVRARIRLDRGLPAGPRAVHVAHAVALAVAVGLAFVGWAPWLAAVAFALLLGRAAWGLSSRRQVVHPRVLGMQELAFALIALVLLAVGYRVDA